MFIPKAGLALVLAVGYFAGLAAAQNSRAGNVTEVRLLTNGADLKLESGAVARIEMIDVDIVRVRLNPAGQLSTILTGALIPFPRPPATDVLDNESAVLLQTSAAIVVIRKRPFGVHVLRADRSSVVDDAPDAVIWDAGGTIANRKVAPPGEAYFGLGARGGPINRRGRVIAMRNTDASAYTEFTDPLYISIPYYYGIQDGRAYGVFFDNPAGTVFDMDAEKNGVVTFGAGAGEIDYYVMTGPTPAAVARAYAKLTGTTPLPPLWSLGYHHSRYGWDSAETFLNLARDLRKNKISCDTLWFDIDYMDGFNALTFSPRRFPSPRGMFDSLAQNGFHSVAIVEPLLLATEPMWKAARDRDHLVKNGDSTTLVSSIWYGDVSFIDFTSTAARAWYGPLLSEFLALGIDGVWNDLNEPSQNFMPQAVYNYYGQFRDDRYTRNLYSLHHVSLTAEVQRTLRPNTRPWAISRSGYAGIQRYSANWSGDTLTSFDSMRVSLQMTLSMGLSGQDFFGHDIGGFLGTPSPELYLRWLQFGAYIPLFRTHSMNDVPAREPWSFGDANLPLIRHQIQQRYRLLPYIYTLSREAAATGEPVVAPLVYHFPQDRRTYSEDQTFLLGPSLLVAPVVEEGARRRSVYLPLGASWIDYYSGEMYQGGTTVDVAAPLDRIPLFVREGAILPTGPVLQHVNEPVGERPLYLDFYSRSPNASPVSTYTLYEDDGNSFDYQRGSFLTTAVSKLEQGGYLLARAVRVAGGYQPAARHVWMRFRGMDKVPGAVFSGAQQLGRVECAALDGPTQTGWCYDGATKMLTAKALDTGDVSLAALPPGTF